MRAIPLAVLLLASSCAAPDYHRWTLQMPFDVSLGEDGSVRGLRFQDEMPVDQDWSLYFATQVLDPDFDGSDPGSGTDIDDQLIEASIGVRHYLSSRSAMQPFVFGEIGLGNMPLDTLDGVDGVYSLMVGVGSLGQIDRDWSIEALIAYRYTKAELDGGAYPGLDFEDALSGVLVFVGIGYTW